MFKHNNNVIRVVDSKKKDRSLLTLFVDDTNVGVSFHRELSIGNSLLGGGRKYFQKTSGRTNSLLCLISRERDSCG